jgi:hypothetical protein
MDTQTPQYADLPDAAKIANIVIDRLGGTSATARLCEVKPPSVSDWRHSGIPKDKLKILRLTRPDVFEGIDPDPKPDATH